MDAIELAYPFRVPCLVQNSPANRVPSHGTDRFATAYAIDFVPVDGRGRTARFGLASLVRPEPPEMFTGFGQHVLAPVAGTVVVVAEGHLDRRAYRGLPSDGYALTQARRVASGWRDVAGNHVAMEASPGVFVLLCHLRQGRIAVPGRPSRLATSSANAVTRGTAPSPTSTFKPSTVGRRSRQTHPDHIPPGATPQRGHRGRATAVRSELLVALNHG